MGAAGIAVFGGGPAGCAAAVTLARAGAEVELHTLPPGRRARLGESLPPGTVDLLVEVFGEGAFIEGDHRRALGNRSRWGAEQVDEAEFAFNPLGEGWHLDRAAFDAALLDATRKSGVKLLDTPPTGYDFAIDATGRRAHVARSRGAQRVRRDRLVAMLWSERDDGGDATTMVEAAERGWSYTAPVAGGRRIRAFMTDADLLPPAGRRRGAIVTDASTSHLDRIAGDDWLAVGDAAVTFDPLSSQGIVTSVLMGREAGRAIASNDLTGYVSSYQGLLHDHLLAQHSYYGIERRWAAAPFWARREAPATTRL